MQEMVGTIANHIAKKGTDWQNILTYTTTKAKDILKKWQGSGDRRGIKVHTCLPQFYPQRHTVPLTPGNPKQLAVCGPESA